MQQSVKKHHKDRGFKTASDGRLIIEENSDSDSDSKSKAFKRLKLEDSDSGIYKVTLKYFYNK